MDLLRVALIEGLRVHRRIVQQSLGPDEAARERLYSALPPVVPFRGRRPHQFVALLDWDHRLPSKRFTLRLHVFFSAASLARFEAAYEKRLEEIQRRDIFPEFDVSDFDELPGDESYDVNLTAELGVESMRLVSAWRRDLGSELGDSAVEVVRKSTQFSQARESSPGRSPFLGDLEAVSWAPPCESGHSRWTVDVWWLTSFDGRIGRGWSFLVDTEAQPACVVSQREFTVRAS